MQQPSSFWPGFNNGITPVAPSAVITALSANDGQITYLAYGWQGDLITIYEAQAVSAPASNAVAAAASLAAQGYIITASGRADTSGNILLIGTRVQGDTMPRPFIGAHSLSQLQTLQEQGYTVIAVIDSTYLGER